MVQALSGAVILAEAMSYPFLRDHSSWVTARAVLLAATGLTAAWAWSATLRVLDGGHGVLSALRPDLRRIGRLWPWLVLLDGEGVLDLLAAVDVDTYVRVYFSPVMPVVLVVFLYVSFAAGLLPMAVLLEDRGVGRAWRLSHGGRRAVLRVLPVVVLGLLLTEVMDYLQVSVLIALRPGQVGGLLLLRVLVLAAHALQGALTAVLLYTAYRTSVPGPPGPPGDGGERIRPAGAPAPGADEAVPVA